MKVRSAPYISIGEQPLLDKAIDGKPLDLIHYFSELPKLDGLRQSNSAMKNTTLESYGLKPPQSQQRAPAGNKTMEWH